MPNLTELVIVTSLKIKTFPADNTQVKYFILLIYKHYEFHSQLS